MDGKKFLDSSLDLHLEGEGLSFHMGMPFGAMNSSSPHGEDSDGEGPQWHLLNVELSLGASLA